MRVSVTNKINCNYKLFISSHKKVILRPLAKSVILEVNDEEYNYIMITKAKDILVSKINEAQFIKPVMQEVKEPEFDSVFSELVF